MRILLLESDRSTRDILRFFLSDLGHEVLVLDHSDETIPFLNGFWPDAILMNYFLDDTTAPQLCEEIENLFGELPSTLIHAPRAEHRFYALRFAETSFLKSPFSPEELQDALDALVPVEIFLTG